MKSRFIILFLLCISLQTYAQLVKWVLPPKYDNIKVKVDNKVIATDSAGVTILWDFNGHRLFQTTGRERILNFAENHALVVNEEGDALLGIVNETGKFRKIPNEPKILYSPEFKDGYITCWVENKMYGYFSTAGQLAVEENALRVWPIHSGLAPAQRAQADKAKRSFYYASPNPDDKKVEYAVNGKPFNPNDIKFLSGINNEGKGIAVIKNKLYWFNLETYDFEPMLSTDGQTAKEYQLTISDDYESFFEQLPKENFTIYAKIGKKGTAYFTFDEELVPDTIVFNDEVHTTPTIAPKKHIYASNLVASGAGPIALAYKGKELLPPQFEETDLLYNDCAFVCLKGKWGILKVHDNLELDFKINKGEVIPFKHQKFETQIRVNFPKEISTKNAQLEVQASSGMVLDKTSKEWKDTDGGNYIQYNCVLEMPESLPAEPSTTISYPISISYDDIKLYDKTLDVEAWHFKYYNVDIIDSESSVSDETATFTIDIKAEKDVGEMDYPFQLKIEGDSIEIGYEKISERRYKCTVSNLKEGENSFNIYITEKGCPPSIFPFELTYIKPKPESEKQEKESIVIKKKTQVRPAKKPVENKPVENKPVIEKPSLEPILPI